MQGNFLLDIFYYFMATVVCVPFFKACGLGSVLGYLVAGMLLGPHALGLLKHADNIQEISQIGIIMLLFVIGLELTPKRISQLKSVIFGAGLSQFCATTVAMTCSLYFLGLRLPASFFVGAALALSSTAFALTYLRDSDQLTKSYGQSSFGILLFQDIIIIPILTIIPFFSSTDQTESMDMVSAVTNFAFLAVVFSFARFALKPLMQKIYESQSKEIFIGSCLMIVTGASLLMDHIGLSKALGAFIAGVFLSSSGLRSDIQSFSVPLKSMMMGVFFMGFGLAFDVNFFIDNFVVVTLLTFSFVAMKFTILLGIGKYIHGDIKSGTKLGLILCQGGEFGLLVASLLFENSLVSGIQNSYLVSSITLSIFLAPILTKAIPVGVKSKKPEDSGAEIIDFKERSEKHKTPEKKAS